MSNFDELKTECIKVFYLEISSGKTRNEAARAAAEVFEAAGFPETAERIRQYQ